MTRPATAGLAARVARHFSDPEWFTTFELPVFGAVPTEDGKDRRLDALAISRIASRGNELVGIEIKSDRSDWLNELASPFKAEAWIRLVDRWYVVAGAGVAKKDELPPGWGLLEETGSGLRSVVPAALLNGWRDRGDHDPVPRELWIRILRRTLGGEGNNAPLKAAYTRGHEAGVKEATDRVKSGERDVHDRLGRLQDTVLAFEQASGIELTERYQLPDGTTRISAHGEWAGKSMGQAVKVVLEHQDVVRSFGQHLESFERNTRDLRIALVAAGWTEPPKESEP